MLKAMKVSSILLVGLLVGLSGCDMDQPGEPSTQPAVGDVLINEILASNDNVNQDPDHGEYGDWVELYNKGTADEDIGRLVSSPTPAPTGPFPPAPRFRPVASW